MIVMKKLDLMLDWAMSKHRVFDLLRCPVGVEFVVTRVHNDCDEEARFDVIRRLVIYLLHPLPVLVGLGLV